jgi:hypothetical protein
LPIVGFVLLPQDRLYFKEIYLFPPTTAGKIPFLNREISSDSSSEKGMPRTV